MKTTLVHRMSCATYQTSVLVPRTSHLHTMHTIHSATAYHIMTYLVVAWSVWRHIMFCCFASPCPALCYNTLYDTRSCHTYIAMTATWYHITWRRIHIMMALEIPSSRKSSAGLSAAWVRRHFRCSTAYPSNLMVIPSLRRRHASETPAVTPVTAMEGSPTYIVYSILVC